MSGSKRAVFQAGWILFFRRSLMVELQRPQTPGREVYLRWSKNMPWKTAKKWDVSKVAESGRTAACGKIFESRALTLQEYFTDIAAA